MQQYKMFNMKMIKENASIHDVCNDNLNICKSKYLTDNFYIIYSDMIKHLNNT